GGAGGGDGGGDGGGGDPSNDQTWVAIALQSASGDAVDGEPYRIVAGGATRSGQLRSDGGAREEDLPPGLCDVSFPQIGERKRGLRPASAPDAVDRGGAQQVGRRDKEKSFPVGTGAEHAFQLRRMRADAVELDAFHGDGAILLPGADPALADAGAARATGI